MISNVVLKIGQLSESPFAIWHTAFKRTDTSMNPQMPLQFEGVGTGVGAVRALIGPLSRVTPHVPLELADLH